MENQSYMKLNISLAQLAFEYGDVETNISKATEMIYMAAGAGNDLVLLPELWASGYDLENWHNYATTLDEGIFRRLSDLARKANIVIGSSLLEKRENIAYNTFVLYGNDGNLLGKYRKVHLFRLLEEEKWLHAGEDLVLAQTPWGQIGLSICYDLRFPEMYRPYALSGARLVLIVAEWPDRRISHWVKLLQARAIENQLFIAGVNKVGESKGIKLGGHSAVVDPWGVPLVEGDDEEGLFTVEVNLKEADKARKQIPVFKDRKPLIYNKHLKTPTRKTHFDD